MIRQPPRSTAPRLVAMSAVLSCVCLALLGVRAHLAGTDFYSYMAWNLFLAWTPIVLAIVFVSLPPRFRGVKAVVCALWLLFLPNAPYMVTDMIHLGDHPGAPAWFDVVMFASFAACGVALGYSSLVLVRSRLFAGRRPLARDLFSVGVLASAAFGVSLGRIAHWNSWDVLSRAPSPAQADRAFSLPVLVFAALFALGLLLGYVQLVHDWDAPVAPRAESTRS